MTVMHRNESRPAYLREARKSPQVPGDRVAALAVIALRVFAAVSLAAVMAMVLLQLVSGKG
jgi:hypothetical protein